MKKLILAVDDSKAIRFLLQTVLGKEFRVVTVPDGYAAMYFLNTMEKPDLVIVDPQLPDMENWELVQQLVSSGMHGDIPLIVLSGMDMRETMGKCEDYGIERYFMKPFNPIELVEEIGRMVASGALDKDVTWLAN